MHALRLHGRNRRHVGLTCACWICCSPVHVFLRSGFFDGMFNGSYSDSKSTTVELDEIDNRMAVRMIEYVHIMELKR